MNRIVYGSLFGAFIFGLLTGSSRGQVSHNASANDVASSQHGISLAEKGKCREALPLLKKAIPGATDKQLKYHAGMAMARCAMSLDQTETAVGALLLLRKEFPHDPEALYITTHFY